MGRFIAIAGLLGAVAGCSTQQHSVSDNVRVIERREHVSYFAPDWSQAKLKGKVDIPPQPDGGMAAFTAHLSYPPELRAHHITGLVRVRVSLDAKGSVVSSRIVSSGGPQLDAIVLRAVRETKWKPAVRSGKPVSFTFAFPVTFSLGT